MADLIFSNQLCSSIVFTISCSCLTFAIIQLEVKRVSADTTTPPLRAEIPKTQQSYQVCELKASVLYSVNVSGINASGVISATAQSFSTGEIFCFRITFELENCFH